jgi:hypothetical protein
MTRDGNDEAPMPPGRAVEHRAVRRRAAGEVVALDDALEALALAGADHVDGLARREDRAGDLGAGGRRGGALGDLDLAADAGRRHVGLGVVAGHRLVGARRLAFDEADLDGFVAVAIDRTWPGRRRTGPP